MVSKKTIRLAIEAMQKQIQKLAVDANLYDQGIADNPTAENRSKKRKELLAAIGELSLEAKRK